MDTISKHSDRQKLVPSSSQLFSSLCYVLAITIALLGLNLFTARNARQMLFHSKQTSMQDKAKLISSSLSGMEYLSVDGVRQVVEVLGENSANRLIVTDNEGFLLFDNLAKTDERPLVMLPEVFTALSGRDVFHCSYNSGVLTSTCAASVMFGDVPAGAVYLMEIEAEPMITMIEQTTLQISAVLECAVILIALLFSLVFSTRMQTILQSFPRIRAGDYSYKISLGGNDELSALAGEFNKLTDKLADAEESRRRFVSDASHELKTPLASIKLLSETILQNDLDADTQREFVGDICSESERLNRMTQKLLMLSKMDSIRDETEMEVISIDSAADRVCRMLTPVAAQRGITLSVDISPECQVLALEDDIYQVLFNLVENAIKYNRDNGSVTITGTKNGEDITLIVQDTGVGIPEDARAHIFERFYRVDKARSRAAGGAGLGLSIVHDMVERNYGSILVEPGEDCGTRFVLKFPFFGVEEEPV